MPRTPIYDVPNLGFGLGRPNPYFIGTVADGTWHAQITRDSVEYSDMFPAGDEIPRPWKNPRKTGKNDWDLTSILQVRAFTISNTFTEEGEPDREFDTGWNFYDNYNVFTRYRADGPPPGTATNAFRAVYPFWAGEGSQYHFPAMTPGARDTYFYVSLRVRILGHRIPCSLRWNPNQDPVDRDCPTSELTEVVNFNKYVGWEQVVENPRPTDGSNHMLNMRLCPI